jgi:hypothetical protein
MSKNVSNKKLEFFMEFNEAMRGFEMGFGEYTYNDIKSKKGEMTLNFLIPITAVLIVSDEKHNLFPKYGKQFLSYCNGSNLDNLCLKHKIDRFSKITKKQYINLFMEIAHQFGMEKDNQPMFLVAKTLTHK